MRVSEGKCVTHLVYIITSDILLVPCMWGSIDVLTPGGVGGYSDRPVDIPFCHKYEKPSRKIT